MDQISARTQVRQATMTAAYHRGAAMTFADIRAMVPQSINDEFVANEAELAGYPVWTSAPASAIRWGGF